MSSRVRAADLRRALGRRPRIPLAHLPTPLEPAPHLGNALGGISIYVKRDDLTGLALGGNKARQLEFLLGEAVYSGATAIITGAGVDSNHCRQLAAACAKLGLRACLILRGECPARVEGNLLLDRIFGAECRFISTERFYAEFDDVASEWADALSTQGERTYVINTLGRDTHSVALAALGYVQGALELEEQFEMLGWRPDVAYFCSGAATQAGLVLARKCLDLPYRLVGISASPFIPDKPTVIAQVATRAARLFDLDLTFQPDEIINEDGYIGDAYGALTSASVAALRLAARTEGLLLDPTYTAKALAGLVDHVRQGRIRTHERVLFLHTGGAPALFLSRNEALAETIKTFDDNGLS